MLLALEVALDQLGDGWCPAGTFDPMGKGGPSTVGMSRPKVTPKNCRLGRCCGCSVSGVKPSSCSSAHPSHLTPHHPP